MSFGGALRWLTPAMGPVRRYRIVEALLDTQFVRTHVWKEISVLPARTLPPGALALATYPLCAVAAVPLLPIILAALALFAIGSGLALRRPDVLPFVLVMLAAEYLTAEAVRWPAIDPATPLYAGGLLILAETASWTLEPHWPSRADPDMGRRRALRLAGMVLGAIALNIALLWVAAVPVASGLILTAGGVVAALGSLVLVAVVALIARGRGPS